MLDVILQVTCVFFAVYGVLMIALEIVNFMYCKRLPKGAVVQPILVVKNCGEIIEGIVRSIIISNFLNKIVPDYKLTIIDNGSIDETKRILLKLQKDHNFIEVLDSNQFDRILNK